jgi:serine/threonine protein kinase
MRKFGRYIIKEAIEQGGMANVFLAFDPLVEREVALKVLPRQLTVDTRFQERFKGEAKMIAGLEHPAIVPIYDFGEHEGQLYLVMRFMRGGTLTSRLQNGALSLTESQAILNRICSALDKAHQNKIIHRDLKPGNILFDEDGEAYLADFGIARLALGTQTTTIGGTLQYMAPEQAEGKPLDARTDVYQMGIVLFEMLTGDIPFQANTPAAMLYQHVHADIPSIHKFNPDLPPNIQTIIQRAMEKDREKRYATAGELATAYRKAIFNRVAKTELLPPEEANEAINKLKPRKQPRKKKGLLAIVGLLVIVVAGYFLLTYQPWCSPITNINFQARLQNSATFLDIFGENDAYQLDIQPGADLEIRAYPNDEEAINRLVCEWTAAIDGNINEYSGCVLPIESGTDSSIDTIEVRMSQSGCSNIFLESLKLRPTEG